MDNVFLSDVLDQPASMRRAIDSYQRYGSLLSEIRTLQPRQVLFTGMGSSHDCSQGAVIALNRGGIPARMESTSEIVHYEWNGSCADTLLVLVSQSGESGEIVELLRKLPEQQKIIGITNDPSSSLGRRADICLLMQVEPELAVSTRTYLASLILTDLTATALLGEDPMETLARYAAAVDALESFARDHAATQERISAFCRFPASICYIGRGFSRATAQCGALFTRETAKYPALAFDGGEFRHGPFEMVDEDFCAMIFAPQGKSLVFQKNLTEAIVSHGGRVVFVTDSDISFDSERILILRHDAVGERYAAMVQILCPQLFANAMAIYRGFAPGIFRLSSKITTVQ